MNYISISQAAAKFNVSERYVRKLCADGMIEGVAKIGKTWIVPENASIQSSPSINLVFGGDDNVGLETAIYLIEKGEKVCFISNSEKQILKAVNFFQNTGPNLLYNVDASDEEALKKIRDNLSKYRISKIIFSENSARFDKVENNVKQTIQQNFRGPIYSTVLVNAIFYPLMSNTNIIAFLHEKATTIGLPNESAFSAACHGLDGYLESIIKASENDDKIDNVLKVYTGAIDSDFWYTNNAEDVVKFPDKNRIPPRDLARIAIDTIYGKNTAVISEIRVRRNV